LQGSKIVRQTIPIFIEQIERGGQGNDLDTGVPDGEAGIPP
jgi:hypothetical protein